MKSFWEPVLPAFFEQRENCREPVNEVGSHLPLLRSEGFSFLIFSVLVQFYYLCCWKECVGLLFLIFIRAYRQVLSDLLRQTDTVSRVNIMKTAKVALVQSLVPCKAMDDKESERPLSWEESQGRPELCVGLFHKGAAGLWGQAQLQLLRQLKHTTLQIFL